MAAWRYMRDEMSVSHRLERHERQHVQISQPPHSDAIAASASVNDDDIKTGSDIT